MRSRPMSGEDEVPRVLRTRVQSGEIVSHVSGLGMHWRNIGKVSCVKCGTKTARRCVLLQIQPSENAAPKGGRERGSPYTLAQPGASSPELTIVDLYRSDEYRRALMLFHSRDQYPHLCR